MRRASLRASRSGTLQLGKLVKKRKLRPRSVLEVRILEGGKIGKVTRYTTARKRLPRRAVKCLAPGALKPGAC